MSMADAAPTGGARILRVLAIAWIFVVAGPPVGTLLFLLLTAIIGMGKGADLAGLSWVALFSVIYGLPFGYMIGVTPALVAGLAIGIKQAWFGKATIWFALAVGLLIGLGFLFATGQPLWPATESGVDFTQFSVPFIVTTTFSTLCCWAMIRHWHLPPQTSARVIP